MKTRVKKLWVKALRSKKYKQGHGVLRDDNKSIFGTKKDTRLYCCLGVLTDLYAKEKGISWSKARGKGGTELTPRNVCKWAGLKVNDPEVTYKGSNQTLSNLNDNGRRFQTIAKVIEAQL